MPTAPQIRQMTAGEKRVFAVSFVGMLDGTEVLDGTPTAVEVTTSDLTIANIAETANQATVSTGSLTIDGATVTTGQALQFTVSGGTAGTCYTIRLTASTDASPSPGQTLILDVILDVVA